jgi:hypothetical protein
MQFVLTPWHLFFAALAGWVHRQRQEANNYLRTENRVLKEQFGSKRILLTDDQRRRLAVKGKILGRQRLQEVGTLFTPDTILRWHRQLVAKKWDTSENRKPDRLRRWLNGKRYLIMDRDASFCDSFRATSNASFAR